MFTTTEIVGNSNGIHHLNMWLLYTSYVNIKSPFLPQLTTPGDMPKLRTAFRSIQKICSSTKTIHQIQPNLF
jgi:hypothetical protein